jgi:hypothetical protein
VEWIIHQGNVTKKTLPQNTRWYPLGKEAASTSLKIKRLSINGPIARLEGAVNEERLSVSPGAGGGLHSSQSLGGDRSIAIGTAPKCTGWSKSIFLTLRTALK